MIKPLVSLQRLSACGIVLGMVLSANAENANAAEKDARVYEMRVYYAAEGKLDALEARLGADLYHKQRGPRRPARMSLAVAAPARRCGALHGKARGMVGETGRVHGVRSAVPHA